MESKKEAQIKIMDGSRGIQLDVGKYKLSMGMSAFHYSSNSDSSASYAQEMQSPSAISVEVALLDGEDKFLLPEQVAGWIEVSKLPRLIQALAHDDLPCAIRICGQTP